MSGVPSRYMVIERFRPGAASEIYQRFRERGRMLPAGVQFEDSWVDLDLTRCFVLLRTAERALIEVWMAAWSDLVEFEVVPVQDSAHAARASEAAR